MDKVQLQARIEALQLKKVLAVTTAKLKVLEKIDSKPTFEPEDDMNAYLDGYLKKELFTMFKPNT